MYTSPSPDDMLAGLIAALNDEILPALASPKAQATAVMMQSVIQELRQVLPVYDALLVEEHNGMLRTLTAVSASMEGLTGDAAERIRKRGAAAAGRDDLAEPPERAAIMAAHREVGELVVQTVLDLDELQRAGEDAADDALQLVRAHLAPRLVRDMQTMMVGTGFVGRS